MREPVEQGSGEPLGAQDLGPAIEGQVGGDQQARALVGPADDLEEEFGPGLGAGDVAELVEDEQVVAFELLVEAFELALLAAFEELGDQAGDTEEAHAPALLNWACDAGRIRVNPIAKVKPPGKVRSCARALDVPDYERLVAVSREPWQTLWATLGSTGMRIGECLKLRWPQINWPTRTIRVLPQTSKSRKQRDVPMTEDTYARLRMLYERAREGEDAMEPDGIVFATREGKARGNNVRRAFLKCLKRAGLDSCGFTIHSLRHTFATSLLRMGANPKVVSELRGHATIRVTLDVYGHVFPADNFAAMDLLPYGRGTSVAQGSRGQLQRTGA